MYSRDGKSLDGSHIEADATKRLDCRTLRESFMHIWVAIELWHQANSAYVKRAWKLRIATNSISR